tara:strand:+ start:484 stop:732 length:249 start_codon:yes stop_codon:yes gene_type:complete
MTAVSDNLSSVAVAYAAADDIIAASLEEAKKVRASAIAAQEAELQRIEDEKAAEVERLRVLAEEEEARKKAEEEGEGEEPAA